MQKYRPGGGCVSAPSGRSYLRLCLQLFDGEDVIKYIEENSVDAVITDIRMPVKTGIDVASFIYDKFAIRQVYSPNCQPSTAKINQSIER